MASATKQSLYYCPGEEHPISHAVHLARLASYYQKCFECPLRHQAGHLPVEIVEEMERQSQRRPRRSLIAPGGIRGVYLNQINRFHVAALVNGFVRLLSQGEWSAPATSLSLAIGYQEHPAAPDLMVGVVNALRASGVRMIDAGLTTAPLLSFTMNAQQADAGVLITGAGCDPAGIGLDFFLKQGVPLGDRHDLLRLEAARELATYRLPDAQGGYRTCDESIPYLEHLRERFHALRPLRVCVGTSLRKLNDFARLIFEPLPCSLDLVSLPRRKRELTDPDDADIERVALRVRETASHLGLVIDDDAQSCAVVDERGELVPVERWTKLLSDHFREARRRQVQPWTGSHTTMPAEMLRAGLPLGIAPDSRVWYGETTPESDALVTLSLLLEALSRSDADLSQRVAA